MTFLADMAFLNDRFFLILTLTKYHENLLRVSPLSFLSTVIFFSSLEKMPNEVPNSLIAVSDNPDTSSGAI